MEKRKEEEVEKWAVRVQRAKALAAKAGDLNLIPRTNCLEGENQLSEIVL